MSKPFIRWTWWHVVRIVLCIVIVFVFLGAAGIAYNSGYIDGHRDMEQETVAIVDRLSQDDEEIAYLMADLAYEDGLINGYDEGYQDGFTEACFDLAETWATANYNYYLMLYDYCLVQES